MDLLTFLLPPLVTLVLRWPNHRVSLENNGGVFLYDIVFGTNTRPTWGQEGTLAILSLAHRQFRDRWGYRWVRAVYTGFAMWASVAVALLGRELGGDVGGLAAGLCFAVFSNLAHFVPWFTNSERSNVAFMGSAYLLLLWGLKSGSPLLVGVAGLSAGLAVFCKVSALIEVPPLLALAWLPPTAAPMSMAARLVPLLLGLLVVPGCAEAWAGRTWRGGRLLIMPGAAFRYKKADEGMARKHRKGEPGSLLASAFLQILQGTIPLWAFAVAFAAWRGWGGMTRPVLLVTLWLVSAFLGMAVQRVFSPGHWVPLLTPLCTLAGAGIAACFGGGMEGVGIAAFLAAIVLVGGLTVAVRTSMMHPWRAGKFAPIQRGIEDFAKEIAKLTEPSDTIFQWGWWPQIYVLAGRTSAAPSLSYCAVDYLDTLLPDWKVTLLRGFATTRPRILVLVELGFPLETVAEVLGLRYAGVVRPLTNGSLMLLRLQEPGGPLPPAEGDPLEQAIRGTMARIEERGAAGDLAAAERAARALVDLDPMRFEPLLVERLAGMNPGWKLCPSGALLPDLPGEVVVEEARNGEKTCSVRAEGGVVQLHSGYEPSTEARRQFERAPQVASANGVLLLGLGLGYGLCEVAARAKADARIVVVERRRQVFAAFSRMDGAARLLADPRITLLVSVEPKAVLSVARAKFSDSVVVVANPTSTALDGAYYAQVDAALGPAAAPPG